MVSQTTARLSVRLADADHRHDHWQLATTACAKASSRTRAHFCQRAQSRETARLYFMTDTV